MELASHPALSCHCPEAGKDEKEATFTLEVKTGAVTSQIYAARNETFKDSLVKKACGYRNPEQF